MKFFKDILKEERDGKFSSKKVWGFIVMLSLVASYVVDGLHFYEVNVNLFNTMAILGGTLLGLRSVSKVFIRKSE